VKIDITVPWPPSVNQYWRQFQGRMLISAQGRKYREAIIQQVWLEGKIKRITGDLKVTIEAFRPDERRRDLDNLLKSTLDALAHAGLYEDDSQIRDLRIYWAAEKGGKLNITIEEMQ
jgi:crossover junction endodeoxyribonuclease RusA